MGKTGKWEGQFYQFRSSQKRHIHMAHRVHTHHFMGVDPKALCKVTPRNLLASDTIFITVNATRD